MLGVASHETQVGYHLAQPYSSLQKGPITRLVSAFGVVHIHKVAVYLSVVRSVVYEVAAG